MTIKRKQNRNPNRRHMCVPSMHFSASIYNKNAIELLESLEKRTKFSN
ncbi:hypothetical protein ACTQ5K_21605 [Niallia sp. Sow4_A1]|jgi:hypothetical protein|nr:MULTISPECIES: hypothetical protein [unclassified Bacillus (in: firmicutes)]